MWIFSHISMVKVNINDEVHYALQYTSIVIEHKWCLKNKTSDLPENSQTTKHFPELDSICHQVRHTAVTVHWQGRGWMLSGWDVHQARWQINSSSKTTTKVQTGWQTIIHTYRRDIKAISKWTEKISKLITFLSQSFVWCDTFQPGIKPVNVFFPQVFEKNINMNS